MIAESGRPPASDFAVIRMSGTTPVCSTANSLPVRPKPVCTSSAISRMPCFSVSARSRGQVVGGRHHEAALAQHRLHDHRRDLLRLDVALEEVLERVDAGDAAGGVVRWYEQR